jgi:hypothetical protein
VQFADSSRTGLSVEREAEEFFGIGRINEVSRRLRETKHVSRLRRLFFDILRTQGFHPGLGVCRAYGAGARLIMHFCNVSHFWLPTRVPQRCLG